MKTGRCTAVSICWALWAIVWSGLCKITNWAKIQQRLAHSFNRVEHTWAIPLLPNRGGIRDPFYLLELNAIFFSIFDLFLNHITEFALLDEPTMNLL